MNNQPISLSVIIPVYNEAGSIRSLFYEVKAVCERGLDGIPFDYEIIIVNDGSDDETDEVCRTLSPLTYVCFRKNYGQTSAMDYGFKIARGDYITALDGDGQNDPADIPTLLRYLIDHDLDVVSGWRKDRHDSPSKVIASRGANLLRHLMIHDGIQDSGCTLKIYRRECFDGLDLYGEQHRFIPALLKIRGFQIGELPVHHRARESGKSKYGFSRIIKGFLDLINVWFWNKFASRPLHLLGGSGLLFLLFGMVAAVIACVRSISSSTLDIVSLTFAMMFISVGAIFFALGLLSEMVMRIYYKGQGRPYRVRSVEHFTDQTTTEGLPPDSAPLSAAPSGRVVNHEPHISH